MAEKSPAKKFLIFVSTLLGSIAIVGAVVATSIERRLQGELRSSVFDGLKPEWLRTYTFGNPEMLETDLAQVDYEMFYTDLLTGKGLKFSEKNNSLTAEESKFNVQLLEGDRLKFFSNSKEIGNGKVESVTSSNELLLSAVHFHYDSPLDANDHSEMLKLDSVRFYRPFTGTAYRFYGNENSTLDSLQAPEGYHFSAEGTLVEGEPVEHGDHGGHGGHGGGHGESYTYVPTLRPGEFQAYYLIF